MFMSLKYTAIASAAIWPSPTLPLLMPRTKNAISSRLSAAPSRFLRIISCGSSVWVRSDAIGNPHVLDLASVGEEGAARGLGIVEPVAALAAEIGRASGRERVCQYV